MAGRSGSPKGQVRHPRTQLSGNKDSGRGNHPLFISFTRKVLMLLPSTSLLDSFQLSQLTTMLVIYLIAITAEAMSGALAAGRRDMDIFGVAVIAFVTALGGGTIRDMVLGHYPIGWTQHPEYVYLVIGAGLLTTVIARYMRHLKQVFCCSMPWG